MAALKPTLLSGDSGTATANMSVDLRVPLPIWGASPPGDLDQVNPSKSQFPHLKMKIMTVLTSQGWPKDDM